LKYERAVNISSTVLNAILIHLKGDSKCTPKKPVIDSIETKIKFKDVGIDPTRIQNDPNLLVVIFNNETLKQEDTVEFRLVVNGSQNYNEALEEILAGNKGCPEDVIDPILQPREQNGDVIGG
jgi:hypothetical protein